jgi:hypothetical protein
MLPNDGAALIDFIVVDQDAARGFYHAHALQPVHGGVGAYVRVENGRGRPAIVEDALNCQRNGVA